MSRRFRTDISSAVGQYPEALHPQPEEPIARFWLLVSSAITSMARVDSALRAILNWARNRSRASNFYSRFVIRLTDATTRQPLPLTLDVPAVAVLLNVFHDRDLKSAVLDDSFRICILRIVPEDPFQDVFVGGERLRHAP